MADTPLVLFMSCSNTHPDELIKSVLKVVELPQKIIIEENIYAFSWLIDNKYYSAEVYLCSFPEKKLMSKQFAERVQAVVLHFDSSQSNALDKVQTFLPFIEEYDPEIKLLVTNNFPNETCTKKDALEWCVNKNFELIELEPIIDDEESELEDDFPEITGIPRIIQALNAHVWPNLVMNSFHQDNNLGREKLELVRSLEEILENDNDFSMLFSQLSDLKERVSSYSGAEKKKAAEEVVKAFWKAMGGDDDEFSDH